MKNLIIGSNGQIGYDFVECLEVEDIEFFGANGNLLDITREKTYYQL